MFISVIDGITGPIARAGPAVAPAAAEETVAVPLGGLIEWDGRNTNWDGIRVRKRTMDVLGGSFCEFFWIVEIHFEM